MDTVNNIASTMPANHTYFAAIPGASSPTGNPSSSNPGFTTVTDCGACVEITGANGKKIVATIIDECPISSNGACASAGHLDLSTQAFVQLGYPNGSPTGTTWKFVPCPVTGDIVAVPNVSASNNQWYFQNAAYPITSVNGAGATQFGYFNVGPGPVTLTSASANVTINGTLPSGGGSVGVQFASPSGCY